MNPFLHVVGADYLNGYRLRLSFSDGVIAEVDLSDELEGSVFEPLKDPRTFQQFQLIGHTLTWKNGADFAPQFLKVLAQKQGSLLSKAG